MAVGILRQRRRREALLSFAMPSRLGIARAPRSDAHFLSFQLTPQGTRFRRSVPPARKYPFLPRMRAASPRSFFSREKSAALFIPGSARRCRARGAASVVGLSA